MRLGFGLTSVSSCRVCGTSGNEILKVGRGHSEFGPRASSSTGLGVGGLGLRSCSLEAGIPSFWVGLKRLKGLQKLTGIRALDTQALNKEPGTIGIFILQLLGLRELKI